MPKSRWLLFVVPLAVVALAWWALGSEGEADAAPPVVRAETPEPAGEMEMPEPVAAEVEELQPEPAAPAEAPELAEADTDAPAGPESAEATVDLVSVAGRLFVVDEHGQERLAGDGSFQLRAWSGNRSQGDPLEVPVVAGSWSAEVPQGHTFEPRELVVGDSPATLVRADGEEVNPWMVRLAVPPSGEVDLVVRLVLPSRLFVRSAESGHQLADIELLVCSDWDHGDGPHASTGERGCRSHDGLVSPVDLDTVVGDLAHRGRRTIWARAPDHAWGSLEVDFQRGGERVLRLESAGAVEVVVQGVRAADEPRLRVRAAGEHKPVREITLAADDTVLVEGLEAGAYALTAELGEWWQDPRVLARAEVQVHAGGRTPATLVLESAGEIVRVPLAGVITLPAAWEMERVMLTANLLDTPVGGQQDRLSLGSDEMEALPDGPGAWAWRLPDVQPGRWLLGTFRPDHSIVVTVGPAGREDVRLDVPPPGRVELTLLDASTGLAADVHRVNWFAERPPGVTGGGLAPAERDPDTGLFVFDPPQGTVVVHIWDPGYTFIQESLEVGRGVTRHTTELTRSCGLAVSLRDGDTLIPWDSSWDYPQLERDGKRAMNRSMSQAQGVLRLGIDQPGTWSVSLPEIPGYEPAAALTVEVPPGEFAPVEFELVRRL